MSKLDAQLIDVQEKIAAAQEAERILLQKKKEELKVKETYPDAEYVALPDGSTGYATRLIHLQTPGIRRRFFMNQEKRISCFVALTLKLGKGREVLVANISSGYVSPKEVFEYANNWEAQEVKKRRKNDETEVVPEVRQF